MPRWECAVGIRRADCFPSFSPTTPSFSLIFLTGGGPHGRQRNAIYHNARRAPTAHAARYNVAIMAEGQWSGGDIYAFTLGTGE